MIFGLDLAQTKVRIPTESASHFGDGDLSLLGLGCSLDDVRLDLSSPPKKKTLETPFARASFRLGT